MIIDYNKKDSLNGMKTKTVCNGAVCVEKAGEGNDITFINFPHLDISWTNVKNCRFESCRVINPNG